jgi:ABC-type sugar transport system permease subunit
MIDWLKRVWPLLPATLYLVGFLLIVVIYLLGLGLTNPETAHFPSIRSFCELFSEHEFADALGNTILFVVVGTPLELLAGLFLSLLLYKNFFLRDTIRSIFLIPLAIPALVTAMLIFILFDFPGGHINDLLLGKYPPFPAIISGPIPWRGTKFFALTISLIGKIWRDTPISTLILLAGLNSIDPELFDAAKTMGASFRSRLQKIILPLLVPSMSVVLLLRSVEMWKEFIFPFVLAGRHRLLGTLIDFYYNDIGNSNMAAAVAIALVVCIIISTLILFAAIEMFKKVSVHHR